MATLLPTSDASARAQPGESELVEWLVGSQRVVQGDCLKVMASLDRFSIDVVITSPPYNLGIQYRSYDDRKPREQYLLWLERFATQLWGVMKDGASLFLNMGATGSDPWVAIDVANAFRGRFVLQNNIVWIKSLSIDEDTFGHFKPITSKRYLNNNHESIFHFTKSGAVEVHRLAIGVPYKDKSNLGRWQHAKQDRRCAGNVWFIPYKTVRSKAQKFDHPAGFPEELPARCMKLHGGADLGVLDPFLGAGTTLVAAEELGHRGTGIEVDAEYARVARDRLRERLDG